jgi:hypothetical protein
MVAGLQHDASVSKLKLLELERAVRTFTFLTQTFPFDVPFLERRSRKIPFQSVGGELRRGKGKASTPALFF